MSASAVHPVPEAGIKEISRDKHDEEKRSASSASAGPGDRDHLAAWAFGISLCVSTQEIMHAGDGQGTITHCKCDAFGCAGTTVAGRKNSGK